LLSKSTEIFMSSLLLQEYINCINLMQKPLASQLGILIIYLSLYISFVISLESEKQLTPSSWPEAKMFF